MNKTTKTSCPGCGQNEKQFTCELCKKTICDFCYCDYRNVLGDLMSICNNCYDDMYEK